MTDYIKSETLALKHFDHLWPFAYPNKDEISYTENRKMVEDGSWNNLGGLLENAIHATGSIPKDNSIGQDFVDISDAKLTTVRISSKGRKYSAPIANIHRKRGFLRVVCYERKLDKFYYFLIPYEAYKDIPKKSNIEIPFELNGNPKKKNRCRINWWNYFKETFHEICIPVEQIQLNISSPNLDLFDDSKNHPSEQISSSYTEEDDQQQSLDFGDTQPTSLF